MNIAERLKYARCRTGLTGSEAGKRTEIGKSSLSEFENGKREPSLSQLQRLARVYRRSVTFFLAEGEVTKEVVLWRAKPATEAVDVEAQFLQLCEQYHNLEIWTDETDPVGLPSESQPAASYSYERAEDLANRTRNELKLGDRPGLCLLSVLEEAYGIKVFHLPFTPSGPAASTKSKTFGAAILLNANNVRWRRNFDLAHELFHLLTWDVFQKPTDGESTSSYAGEEEEKFANCFAGNLLMPSDVVRSVFDKKVRDKKLSFEDLFDVARQFDVSVEALLWRIYDIQLLHMDRNKTKALVKHAGKLRHILEERKDSEPPKLPERYEALAVKALRHGLMSIGRFAEYLGISRQKAMRYVEQEITDDEKIPVASA